jgi:uncharacterized SAM-binding protein YcdF (DUF218 family)
VKPRRGVLLASLLGAAGATGAAPAAGSWLIHAERIETCDLMVVPEGGARERFATAVELMQGHACPRILFTGIPGSENARTVREFVRDLDPGAVEPPSRPSASTYEDALVALEAAATLDARSVLVVTSPYHTRRAAAIFRFVFSGSGIEVGIYPSASFYMHHARWWASTRGWRMVGGEYVKLLLWQSRREMMGRALIAGAAAA